MHTNQFRRYNTNALKIGVASSALLAAFTLTAMVPVDAHAAKRKAAKTKVDKGTGETLSERERRLKRECKGRVNAGACEGFTR